MEIFTTRFNELLEETATRQAEIAESCHISRQAVNDYRKGRNYPSLPILVAICKYFNVTSDFLLGLSDF